MSFDATYSHFIKKHEKARRGEALRRLKEGHGHAEQLFLEQLWWPAFGSMENLHPEYEVSDFKDGIRYLDFAYLNGHLRLAIEIDGYGPHLQKINRTQFADQLTRQNHLVIDGWKILRFSYDDVKDRPRMCIQLLQQFMGKWLSSESRHKNRLSSEERDIMRMAIYANRQLTPADVCELLGIEQQKSRKLLRGLIEKNFLVPAGDGRKRISVYKLSEGVTADIIGI